MNVKSIKFKLIGLMAVSLLVIAVGIVTISLSKASDALVQSNMALLDAVKESKKDHIVDFLTTIKLLILSKAGDMATAESIWALDDSFQELEDIEGLSLEKVENSLLKHYDNEYLNRVNYKMKNSAQKRPTKEYLPQSTSGQVAQFLYIADNTNKVGEKEKLA
ncbi:MAG: methyl-accepting chemotaxis protein, partial [Sulfurimonas sp.]|nr:methyl-accepting chemotaxis protein [Sulfurimonas sp.]